MSDNKPIVTIEMEDGGIIKLELYPSKAPQTVNNFINLINKNFYDGLIFHRTIPGFMAQGGDPEGTGMGGPGYGILGEFKENGIENNISHGMDNVDKIVKTRVITRSPFGGGKDRPVEPPVMKKVTVETFGVDYPEPDKYEK